MRPSAHAAVSPATASLTKRIPHKRLVQCGLVLSALAVALLTREISATMQTSSFIPGLALYGVGLGMVLSQINNLSR